MKPLIPVPPQELKPGQKYLIEYVGQTYHSHPKCKGIFISNDLPTYNYQCIISKFNNIEDNMLPTIKPHFSYNLQDCFYKYYEANALQIAYTRHVLRHITGDPNFDFYL